MSQKLEPPSSAAKVEIFVDLVDGSQLPYGGESATDLLATYQSLVARGGLKGWQIIEGMLGDDVRPPPRSMQIWVNGKEVARIPYDKPKR